MDSAAGGDASSARARKSVHFETAADVPSAARDASHTAASPSASASASPRRSDAAAQASAAADVGGQSASDSVTSASTAPFQLSKDDVYTAFQFFDTTGTGVLQMANLKPRLAPFFPDMTMKEYRFLLEEPSIAGAGGDAGSSGSSGRGLAAEEGAMHGLTAAQLWELIDTFQRLYMNPALLAQREASAAAAAAAVSTSSSGSPPRGGAAQVSASNAASPRRDTSPHRSPPRSQATKSGAAATSTHASGLRSSSQSIPPSVMFDVLHGYDPVREAFDVYDPAHTGAVQVTVLSQIMARIGFGELSAEELALLVRTADFDRDGKITLSDFRRLVNMKERFKKKKKSAGSGQSKK